MKWNPIASSDTATRTEEKIASFGSLPIGWRYGRGGPIDPVVLGRALDLFHVLLTLGFFKTDVFPGADGEVLLTGYHGGHYVAVTVNSDGTFHLKHEENNV